MRDTRELAVEPAAAEIVRDIFGRARRGQSLARIAADLTAVEAGGKRWHPTAVRRLLTSERYKQRRPTAVVDGKVWNAAQEALGARLKRSGRT